MRLGASMLTLQALLLAAGAGAEQAARVEVGQPAPAISLTASDGTTHDLEQLRIPPPW